MLFVAAPIFSLVFVVILLNSLLGMSFMKIQLVATAELQNTKKLEFMMSEMVKMSITMMAGTSFFERVMVGECRVGKDPIRRPIRDRDDMDILMEGN